MTDIPGRRCGGPPAPLRGPPRIGAPGAGLKDEKVPHASTLAGQPIQDGV